jgi:hypothetical protein
MASALLSTAAHTLDWAKGKAHELESSFVEVRGLQRVQASSGTTVLWGTHGKTEDFGQQRCM